MSVTRSSVSRMAPELWLHILHNFVPSGAPTTAATQSSGSELRPHVLEYRQTLWAACLVSRRVGTIARVCLYKAALINDFNQLLYFFRTLRTVPALRPLVRSFSWTGTFFMSVDHEAECVDLMLSLTAAFASLPPPATAEDALIHKLSHAHNLDEFHPYQLLAAVLVMLPKLTTLFLAVGIMDMEAGEEVVSADGHRLIRQIPGAYEFMAIRALALDDELIRSSIGHPLLPELHVLILDHIRDPPLWFESTGTPVSDLQLISPQLRYIRIRGPACLGWGPKPLLPSTSVRRLLVRKAINRSKFIEDIQEIYPNLVSLRMVLPHGWDFLYISDFSFEAITKLIHLQHLSLTSPHDLTWNVPQGSRTLISPFLRRMPSLKHLRVDLVWLAARSNTSQLLHIASFLPRSIESLHLLDYWGCDMTSPDKDKHPEFPLDMLPVDFLHQMLEDLLENYTSMGLISLKKVKLSVGECLLASKTAQQSRQSLTRRFWQGGIRLTFTGLEDAREEEDGWWSNSD